MALIETLERLTATMKVSSSATVALGQSQSLAISQVESLSVALTKQLELLKSLYSVEVKLMAIRALSPKV